MIMRLFALSVIESNAKAQLFKRRSTRWGQKQNLVMTEESQGRFACSNVLSNCLPLASCRSNQLRSMSAWEPQMSRCSRGCPSTIYRDNLR
jgi:hypothetical protein